MHFVKYLFCVICVIFTPSIEAQITNITVSGNPSPLVINTAVAGSQPTAVTNSSTTYQVISVLGTTITGSINTNMPTGVTLQIQLTAPPGATSTGFKTMTTTAQTLVTNLPLLVLLPSQAITYSLSATVNAAQVSNSTRTVTFTIQ